MSRLRKIATEVLTQNQIELGAKYFTIANQGLITTQNKPTNDNEVRRLYDCYDNEFQDNGDGLWEELDMWKKNLENPNDQILNNLKKELPWLFNEVI